MPEYKSCLCGCGERVNRVFRTGHDQRLRKAIEEAVGGIAELKRLVESHVGHTIIAKQPGTDGPPSDNRSRP